MYKKGDKAVYSDNQGILLLLSTTYTFLNNTLLPQLISYVEKIIEDHWYGFQRNRSTTDHIFYIHQILLKNANTMRQCISYL
jgi:hypothetical protein